MAGADTTQPTLEDLQKETREIIAKLQARSQFPSLTIDVQTTNDASLQFDKSDFLEEKHDDSILNAKIDAARSRFCTRLRWWNCTNEQTQGACQFTDGKCKAVPVADDKQKSYYDLWLQAFKPIYGQMPDPSLTIQKPLGAAPRRGRRKSISRDVPMEIYA